MSDESTASIVVALVLLAAVFSIGLSIGFILGRLL